MVVNILNLPLYSVVRVNHTDHDYHIYAETVHPLAVCPACEVSESVGYGRNEVLVTVREYRKTAEKIARIQWRCFYETGQCQ